MRHIAFVLMLSVVAFSGIATANTQPSIGETFPPNYMPAGKVVFQQYCASCHGADAKGSGPMAPVLRVPPADLTTLVKRHAGKSTYDGKFPYEYVRNILEFGPGPKAHGSSDMPAWGPIFRYYDKQNERAAQQRIKNLSDYLASVQEK